MLRCANHFNTVVIVVGLASACTRSSDKVKAINDERVMLVSSDQYRSRACWMHNDGSFRAFLIFGKYGNYAVPQFISVNCIVSDDYNNYGESIILHLGTIRMSDSYNKINHQFPELKIGSNVATDGPPPAGDGELYYFKAHLEKVPFPYQTVYAPYKIEKVTGMDISFAEFLGLSREEREELLRSIK